MRVKSRALGWSILSAPCAAALMSVIDGRRAVAAHGPREMPVWGARFEEELKGEPMHTYVGLLQTRSLVDYLRTIQAKP